jgi:hypothetical protein
MSAVITPTQDDIFVIVRAFILSLIDCEVIQGLGNRVPTPNDGFIAVTATALARLSTNVTTYDHMGARQVKMPTQYTIQVDCYGPLSSDWATTIAAMWRDQYGCDQLAPNAQPLYCDEPSQMGLVDGEDEYEQRWIISAILQFNPVVTVSQQYADALTLAVVSVDATFPP